MMTRARLEMRNQNNKIVFGRSMWGYCELSDLVEEFFRIMPDYVEQGKCHLKVYDVSH
jgi:hypothetical protein